MNENKFKRNELLAQTVIKGLQSRNMTGYYAPDKETAKEIAVSMLFDGCKIAHGGSVSIEEIGLMPEIKSGKYNYIDRNAADDKRKAELEAYDSDVFFGSVNAITEDGILINIDGNSNRISAYAYGPKKVVLIVGMNKVAKDVDSAIKRARNIAAPINAQRFNLDTPCSKTGSCLNCKSPDTICCQFLITRASRHKDRIHIILVNDEIGF